MSGSSGTRSGPAGPPPPPGLAGGGGGGGARGGTPGGGGGSPPPRRHWRAAAVASALGAKREREAAGPRPAEAAWSVAAGRPAGRSSQALPPDRKAAGHGGRGAARSTERSRMIRPPS